MTTREILERARKAKSVAATLTAEEKNAALLAAADALEREKEKILAANAADTEKARGSVSAVMLDRLTLSPARIAEMAESVRALTALPDPVGRVLESFTRPDGLKIQKVSVPFGTVAIIYESRPNVASDAAALCLKSGNACVLRGGRDAFNSSHAIVAAMRGALEKQGLPADLLAILDDVSQSGAEELMRARGYVDLLIPRGGAGLIRACTENAVVPCIETGTGICHIYVDKSADFQKALAIVDNAKTSRPSVCNAAEVCLVHKDVAERFLPLLKKRLVDERAAAGKIPVRLLSDGRAAAIIGGERAGEQDFDREFLDYTLAVAVVDGVDSAAEHIARHSTGHSEAIVTEDEAARDYFLARVDSAAVYVNASTRFTDGGQFGLGCEMGISTQKLHARGPMGLKELTSYKYVVYGDGHIR